MAVTAQVDSYARLNVPIALWENILGLYVQCIRFLIVLDFHAFHPSGAFDLVTADIITIVFPSWTHVTLKKMLPNYFHKLVLLVRPGSRSSDSIIQFRTSLSSKFLQRIRYRACLVNLISSS